MYRQMLSGLVDQFADELQLFRRVFDRHRSVDPLKIEEMLDNAMIQDDRENRARLRESLTEVIPRGKADLAMDLMREIAVYNNECLQRLEERYRLELDSRITEAKSAESELRRTKNLARRAVSETIRTALSPGVFTVEDAHCLNILRILANEDELERADLRSRLRIDNGQLHWRLELLRNLTLIQMRTRGRTETINMTDLARDLWRKRGKAFEESVKSLRDPAETQMELAINAVGGDRNQAGRLLRWLRGEKGQKHAPWVRRLAQVQSSPRSLSRKFFSRRESGDRQEQHIGISIKDHQAAGALLVALFGLHEGEVN